MTDIRLRSPSLERIQWIAKRLRKADRNEIAASCGLSPLRAIMDSLETSFQSGVVVVDGKPQIVYGIAIADPKGESAVPWMMATDGLKHWRRGFLKLSAHVIYNWNQEFRNLYNYVDSRNTEAIRWLQYMGFEQTWVDKNYGVADIPFVCMERCATH